MGTQKRKRGIPKLIIGKKARNKAVSRVQKINAIALRIEAERRVLAIRGSHDAPGFEACVEAEIRKMKAPTQDTKAR